MIPNRPVSDCMSLSSPVHKCINSFIKNALNTGVLIESLSLCQHENKHIQLMFQCGIKSPFEAPGIGKGHMQIWIIMWQCFVIGLSHTGSWITVRWMMLSHCWLQTRRKITPQKKLNLTLCTTGKLRHIERHAIERHMWTWIMEEYKVRQGETHLECCVWWWPGSAERFASSCFLFDRSLPVLYDSRHAPLCGRCWDPCVSDTPLHSRFYLRATKTACQTSSPTSFFGEQHISICKLHKPWKDQ